MKLLSRPRLHFIKIVKTNIFRKIKRERDRIKIDGEGCEKDKQRERKQL